MSTKVHAQSITLEQAETYADALVKNDFLTTKGKTVLLQEIKKGEIEVDHPSTVRTVTYTSTKLSKETILQFCSAAITTELTSRWNKKGRAIEAKISPKEPLDDPEGRVYRWQPGFGGGKAYAGCIAPATSTSGFTRRKTLATFLKSGLIDQKIFNDCEAALRSKKLRDEMELLRYMLYRSTYYSYYDFNKEEQISYITSLVKHGILSEEGKAALLKSYKDDVLKTIPEILKESPRYKLVDLHGYAPDPKVTYPVVWKAVQQLLPAFRYSNLHVQMEEQNDIDLIRQDIKLKFIVDSTPYAHRFFYNYRRQKPKPEDPEMEAPRVNQDFHKGINKWLTDTESPFRLYTIHIRDEDEQVYGSRSVGLLLLQEGEDSLISSDNYLISSESFDKKISQKNIQKMLSDFTQQGLFSHLTASEIDSALAKVAESAINSMHDVLVQFPKTLVVFDWETGNLEDPYKQLTKEFMAASRGAFTVSNITDEFAKGWKKAKKVQYGFTMNGKRYEKMLTFNGDWLDPEFMELLKLALAENKVNGAIYDCIYNGQVDGYIFLSVDQHRFIQANYPDLLKKE